MALKDLFRKKNHQAEPVAVDAALPEAQSKSIVAVAEQMLVEANVDLSMQGAVRIPVAELSTLGAAVTTMMPSLRTITQTTSISGTGLYRLANAEIGDTLKAARDGNFWASLKTADGTSKMVKLAEAGPQSITTQSVAALNPATLMMTAALASIEKRLDDVMEMEAQILTFLEQDKESQIEGDLKMLTNMLKEYKHNWQNAEYTANHHKLALDIQRTAEGNIIFYQKQIADALKNNPVLYLNHFTGETQQNLQKRFQYYRMSLYLYSMASFLDVMLLGNFSEAYIQQVLNRIEEYIIRYRSLFSDCSVRLEKIAGGSAEVQLRKGLGTVAKTMASVVGSIPVVKEGPVDEWLSAQAEHLEKRREDSVRSIVQTFAAQSDPHCSMFTENLQLINRLANHTSDIFFDHDSIYLVE